MDVLTAERGTAASGGRYASADSVPIHASLDHLLGPSSGQGHSKGPCGADFPTMKPESHPAPSFLSRVCEAVAALGQLVRRTTGHSAEVANTACSQLELVPIVQQRQPLYVTFLAAGLTGIWGWRAARSLERVIARRYLDITYQIRRPDALSARITAFKILVLGGLVLPGAAVVVASWQSCMRRPRPARSKQDAEETRNRTLLLDDFLPSRRVLLADVLPLSLQTGMRRRVASFHSGLSAFIEAVAPSKQKWEQWASGVRASHISGLQRPSVSGHASTCYRVNSQSPG